MPVSFLDESRHIASEYKGGLKRYASVMKETSEVLGAMPSQVALHDHGEIPLMSSHLHRSQGEAIAAKAARPRAILRYPEKLTSEIPHQVKTASLLWAGDPLFALEDWRFPFSPPHHCQSPGSDMVRVDTAFSTQSNTARYNCVPTDSSIVESLTSQTTSGTPADSQLGDSCAVLSQLESLTHTAREFLATEAELEYMKAFVDGVGAWMDSFGEQRHFSRVIPYRALESPSLLNALLACGAKHLSFANPQLGNTAEWYYNAATMMLMRLFQNSDCEVAECAVTSLVLQIYEVMAGQHLSHGAGARLLIRNLGWDARSRCGRGKGGEGVGAACFWLSVGMEVLQCLEHEWVLTWDPDEWGLETAWTCADGSDDAEEGQALWMQRALYIVAKIVN